MEVSCPDDYTCCRLQSGAWGCCPFVQVLRSGEWPGLSRGRPPASTPQAHRPLSLHPRLCAVRTTCTAARPGFDVTQRRVCVKRGPAGWCGWRKSQPASACQTTELRRVMSPVITSTAALPLPPAVDSRLGSGAAVLPQRYMGRGDSFGERGSVLAWAHGQAPVAFYPAHGGHQLSHSHAQLEEPSRRGRVGAAGAQRSGPEQLPRPPSPAASPGCLLLRPPALLPQGLHVCGRRAL